MQAIPDYLPVSTAWVESSFTWGLQAVGASRTSLSGKGIRAAILDTGFDLTHPDIHSRVDTAHTSCFVPGNTGVEDSARHGTHCIGTLGGPQVPRVGPRYGVACESTLWGAKVLGDDGEGSDSWIVAGINWAVKNRCQVISMSLETPGCTAAPYSKVYEHAAQRALDRQCLVIAAAGNDSGRYVGRICPVSSPANCPSIIAVAAINSIEQGQYTIADFSNCGLVLGGGEVDIAAPGVFIYSSFAMPLEYLRHDGTSMAAPHVAGIAALLFQEDPSRSARDVWNLLVACASPVGCLPNDVGAGLVTVSWVIRRAGSSRFCPGCSTELILIMRLALLLYLDGRAGL